MRMDDAVIDLHRFLGTFNTMEIKHMISNILHLSYKFQFPILEDSNRNQTTCRLLRDH